MIDLRELERLQELAEKADMGDQDCRIDLRDALERMFRANNLLELVRDAERYRWLRNTSDRACPDIIYAEWWVELGKHWGKDFDAYLDAKLREGK